MTPGQERKVYKDQEQAEIINQKVEKFHEDHPRSRKTDQEIAGEIIKDNARNLFPYKGFSPEAQTWLRNMSIAGVKVLEDGYIEVRRWDNTGKHFGKPKRMLQRIDDINAAIRMQEHVLEGYVTRVEKKGGQKEDESDRLDSIEEVIEEANTLFLEWKFAKPEEKEEMKQRLARVILTLEKCRNEFKVRTKEQAKSVLRMKDSRGRNNPSALAARTVAALNNLQMRLQEIQDIAPKVALRKELLVLEKRRNEKLCFKAVAKLRFILRHVFFSRNSPVLRDADVTGLTGKVKEAKELLREVIVEPYKSRRNQALFFIATIENLLKTKHSAIRNKEELEKTIADVITILETK
jgi:hypothetical protein